MNTSFKWKQKVERSGARECSERFLYLSWILNSKHTI